MKTEIKINSGEAVVSLNQNIYPPRIIKEAVVSFKSCCDILFSEPDHVIIKNTENAEVMALEFLNYLISLIKNEDI